MKRALPLILAAALVLPVASATSAAAATSKPLPTVTASIPADLHPGGTVTVTVRRLSRTSPVIVQWGDGATQRLSTACAPKTAAKAPKKCSRTLTHTYTAVGGMTVRVVFPGSTTPIFWTPVVVTETPTPPAPVPPTPQPPVEADSPWRLDMLAQLNALRASVGAAPVTLCAPLNLAADKHSVDMLTRGYFSHYSPDKVGPGERINAEGYRGGWGENIAYGYRTTGDVMRAWIDSPGHYANMISPNFTHVGFGQATSSDGVTFWTQNFGVGGTC